MGGLGKDGGVKRIHEVERRFIKFRLVFVGKSSPKVNAGLGEE